MKILNIIILLNLLCLIHLVYCSDNGSQIPSLYGVYKDYFPIGTAVEPGQLFGSEGEIVDSHFSGITPENVLKPDHVEPMEGVFNFDGPDAIVNYAQKHSKLVRGHVLVWHQQEPKWFFIGSDGKKASRNLLLKRMETYIKTVVGRYKGKIYAWDAVNEAIDSKESDGYRRSDWFYIIGEDYIEKAFRFAHEADPNAKLFYNDYDTTEGDKEYQIYSMLKNLLDDGVPVNGIGMQFHINLDKPALSEIEDSIKLFRKLGLEIHITEMDMSLNPSGALTTVSENQLIRQAKRYHDVMEIFKANKDIIRNVTFWGFNDWHTWLFNFPMNRSEWPLLFDKDLKPKYSYWALVDPSKIPQESTN